MGLPDSVPLEKAVQQPLRGFERAPAGARFPYELIVLLFAAAIFLSGIISPPSLMDDVDSVQAQISRTMLTSGDWVTARLDGVVYLEKAPLKYWMTAVSYMIFGVHDWSARLPIALSSIALAWLVFRFGRWAFSEKAGFYAGLVVATCVGLFLFTRVIIPDVVITLTMALAIWSFLRALDDDEPRPRVWAYTLAVSLAAGVLLKGLIGIVFPLGAGFFYLLLTRQLLARNAWRRLYPFTSLLIFLAIAAPWHVLAILRNPPYLVFSPHSAPGVWRGFFWAYFINEHLLRFLNRRYPRDYNTVPRLAFWLFNLVWLFPWSAYLPSLARLKYRPVDRAGRARVMALCWIAVVMIFFTFSTTQEYYSMPIYPAVALLLGCAMESGRGWLRAGTRIIAVLAGLAAVAVITILFLVRGLPAPGDISSALTDNPSAYTLSLGHMEDLTLRSFAYLRLPLALAALAFLIGAIGAWRLKGQRSFLAVAVMMVLFFQAARLALVVFDPYMSSQPLAEQLKKLPPGRLIVDGEYYAFSSVIFYANRGALLLNGRRNNLEYGSYAPDAPKVFISDADFLRVWNGPERCYMAVEDERVPAIEKLAGAQNLFVVTDRGRKSLLTNQPPTVLAATPGALLHAYSN
jgi:4-amino-4-deoxy-L-arabinose transferase-like glycosyltransferase